MYEHKKGVKWIWRLKFTCSGLAKPPVCTKNFGSCTSKWNHSTTYGRKTVEQNGILSSRGMEALLALSLEYPHRDYCFDTYMSTCRHWIGSYCQLASVFGCQVAMFHKRSCLVWRLTVCFPTIPAHACQCGDQVWHCACAIRPQFCHIQYIVVNIWEECNFVLYSPSTLNSL